KHHILICRVSSGRLTWAPLRRWPERPQASAPLRAGRRPPAQASCLRPAA
ncbi:unnamed protein product, partial [Musa textilis]